MEPLLTLSDGAELAESVERAWRAALGIGEGDLAPSAAGRRMVGRIHAQLIASGALRTALFLLDGRAPVAPGPSSIHPAVDYGLRAFAVGFLTTLRTAASRCWADAISLQDRVRLLDDAWSDDLAPKVARLASELPRTSHAGLAEFMALAADIFLEKATIAGRNPEEARYRLGRLCLAMGAAAGGMR